MFNLQKKKKLKLSNFFFKNHYKNTYSVYKWWAWRQACATDPSLIIFLFHPPFI